jgi:hypothetical protein
MQRRDFCRLALAGAALSNACAKALVIKSLPASARWILDMVHTNPGEKPPATVFLNPRTLADYGYNGQVVLSVVEGVPTFDQLDATLIPPGSKERVWAESVALKIEQQIEAAHQVGLCCFAWMQIAVLPKALVACFKDEICDAQGRVDPILPRTQAILRMQIQEILDRFPKLDGLMIRTGEVYLQDLPYHASTAAQAQQMIAGSSAILHAEQSHIALLKILRDEVCVARNRMVFYRTWDFGEHFHNNPAYYLRVTDAIDPHPCLIFSVKHQKGDFHQLTPFNPTLMIGRHRQIVEIQCQREGYGKGAHPYYIGKGVIEGWEEMERLMKPGDPRGLQDVIHHPLCAGTWTWSRGGGWNGPYIVNEMWCAQNAAIIAAYSRNPSQSEAQLLAAYARAIPLSESDVIHYCAMQEFSPRAVLRGQLTTLDAQIDVWWTRDDKLGNPDLRDFLRRGFVEQAIAEKAEACTMWKKIVALAMKIQWPTPEMRSFVVTSAKYGLCKYEVIRYGWMVLLLGRSGDSAGHYDHKRINTALESYDAAWKQWNALRAEESTCASLYLDRGFDNLPGLGAAVDQYRNHKRSVLPGVPPALPGD